MEDLAQRSSVFLDVGAIDKMDFCAIAGKIEKVKDDLFYLKNKLEKKRNLMYRFWSAPESVGALESHHEKLVNIESDMRSTIDTARIDVKISLLIETFEPVLDAAGEIIPRNNVVRDKQWLLANARDVLGTYTLNSRMNRLASGDARSREGLLNLTRRKMYLEGLTVEADYEKSASYFRNAIQCGITEAYYPFGLQCAKGLGMTADFKKAFTCWMDGSKQQDAECLFSVGTCLRLGYANKNNEAKGLDYFKKAAERGYARSMRGLLVYYRDRKTEYFIQTWPT